MRVVLPAPSSCVFSFALMLACAGITGCGMDLNSPVSEVVSTPKSAAVNGRLHGGPNPIQQANIILWETYTTGISHTSTGANIAGTSSYGSQAAQLGTTTTDSHGTWSIPSFNCDNGEFLYATATGGKTASNAANPNEVLVSPIGACSTLPAHVQVDISELSTLATAYGLGYFLKEDSSHVGDGQELVYIGAPAANNAAVGACTGTGAAMTCVASGLSEAFDNALSLVASVNFSGTLPMPTSANTVPTDPFGNVPNVTGSIPAALLNTLGNILQSCVNTSGGTGGSTACGKLFTAATVNAVAPTDTLQASVNIAQNPSNGVDGLWALAGPYSTSFTPALTQEPTDWSLGITFSASDSTYNVPYAGLISPEILPDGRIFFSQYGKYGGYINDDYTIGIYPNGSLANVRTVNAGELDVADNLGHIYVAASNETSILQLSTADLSVIETIPLPAVNYPQQLIVDRNNNLYLTTSDTTQPLFVLTPGATAFTAVLAPGSTTAPLTFNGGADESDFPAFDRNQNLWAPLATPSTSSTDDHIGAIFTSGTNCTPPTFCSQTIITPAADSNQYSTVLFTSDGTAWFTTESELYQVSSSGSFQSSISLPANSGIFLDDIDGNGNIMGGFLQTGGFLRFSTASKTFSTFVPCNLGAPPQATVCTTQPVEVLSQRVDASGALWLPAYFGSTLTKVLGVTAPSWPYRAYAHEGEMPH